jgi:hypothetical protein
MVLAVAAIVLGGLLVPASYAQWSNAGTTAGGGAGTAKVPATTATLTAPPSPPELAAPPPPMPLAPALAAAPVSVNVDPFMSWALLDRKSGKISGAKNMTATSSTESVIKIWIVSDYLRRLGEDKAPTEQLQQAGTAIRDSDDDAADSLYTLGGGAPVIDRMIQTCQLTDTKAPADGWWWAYTQISARDTVRLGECVKSGIAAGPRWTKWVLDEMSKVRGTTSDADQHDRSGGGRWGIIDGLPHEITAQGAIAIKNGWTLIEADGLWHVNCLAVADDWVLAVLMRYSGGRGLDYGAQVCARVASQLVTPQRAAAVQVTYPQSAVES